MDCNTFAEVAPSPFILSVVTGHGETGQFLAESSVNKIAFTGSTRTAKKVAAACAVNMTPAVLECGGKDPVIVDSDADVKRAAEATLWSAMANAGQTCIGAERVYIHEKVAPYFIATIVDMAKSVHPGPPGIGAYGPATIPTQISVIESHIKDALERGGQAVYGSLKSIKPPYVEPVIITNVPEDSLAMQEETFGPVILINKVKSSDEAIRLSNASRYGLSASVWSKKNGHRIASQLQFGMVAIMKRFRMQLLAQFHSEE
ncbi:MAG: aldehyde dehydrogenase family protein [Actinomycetota bacterium]